MPGVVPVETITDSIEEPVDTLSDQKAIVPTDTMASDIGDKGTKTDHEKLKDKSLWALFILGMGGGLLALLTPCVFPMIPMTVAYFTKQKDKVKGRKMAIFYGLSILGDPTLTWWKGAVPPLLEPAEGAVFNHYPRTMTFKWSPVGIPGATYSIEIDAFGAVNAGKWAQETFSTCAVYHNIAGTSFNHSFVGAQPGRWRVRAKIDGRYCNWSEWRYFRFTI